MIALTLMICSSFISKGWSSNFNKSSSMKELLKADNSPVYDYKIRQLIEEKLNSSQPCNDYLDFILFNKDNFLRQIMKDDNSLYEVAFKKLNKLCSKFGKISEQLAHIHYNTREYWAALRYAIKACDSEQSRSCELAGIILLKYGYEVGLSSEKHIPEAIKFFEKGHQLGNIKSTAMLFDIYDQTFSKWG